MNPAFQQFVESLHPSFQRLMEMTPTRIELLNPRCCSRCIYLFSEGTTHLYVGRTRKFRQRMRQHSIDGAQDNQAVFAFRLAREETGITKAAYSKKQFRKALLAIPAFADAFRRAKLRIRMMDLRYVEEEDPTRQALLEIYVAVALRTPNNCFDTH